MGIGSGKKQIVGVTVSPNIGLEVIVYDHTLNEVSKYGQKFLEYNIASREIQDINLFKSDVSDLFAELEISREKSNIYIVLPNINFGFRSIDEANVSPDVIDSIVAEETEKSYIFKQADPISTWVDVNAGTGADGKYIAHSSIQATALANIQDAISDIGGTIAGIETAVTAIPRGIALTGLCNDVISNNDNWNILLINSNNYSLFQMSGNRLLDYAEIPFAVMSFDGDDIYPALSSAVSQYLPNYPAKKLVIVSQADNVSANTLKGAITFDEDIVAIDSNRYGINPVVGVSDEVIKQTASSMTMGALGAVAPKWGGFPTLNFVGNVSYTGSVSYGTINIAGKEIDITSSFIMIRSIIISAILGILAVAAICILMSLSKNTANEVNETQSQIDTTNTEIQNLEKKLKGNITSLIKQIMDSNKLSVNYYDSLSTDIPSNVWLTYYINKNGKEVGIEGLSTNINDVYSYYRSLKALTPNSDIKLNKLDVFSEEEKNASDNDDADKIVLSTSNGQQAFTFEVSNTAYTKSFDENGNKKEPTEEELAAQKEGKKEPKKSTGPNEGGPSGGGVPSVPDVDANLKEAR